jgi:hypothetical protein
MFRRWKMVEGKLIDVVGAAESRALQRLAMGLAL